MTPSLKANVATRNLLLSILCLVLLAPPLLAQAAPKSVPRDQFEASQKIDPAKLEAVDNPDGTWSYRMPESFDPEIRVRGKILTWRYAGQGKYEHKPGPVGPREWIATDEEPLTPEQQLRAMQRIDRWGRIWRVEAVDRDAWQAAIDEANGDSAENEDEPTGEEREDEPAPKPGTRVLWYPQPWNHSNCDSAPDPVNETHVWSGESRTAINGGHDRRQSTAVQINTSSGICTGVILKQKYVLTAAHCVSTDRNNPVAPGTVQVCRDDIANACITAADIDLAPGYGGGSATGGGTDFADDWAIIELTSSWVLAGFSRAQDMDMSRAGDSILDALTNVNNLGFPGFAPNCASAGGNTLFHNREQEPIAATTTRKLRLKLDTTPGHSGGPNYYCPRDSNNVCGSGDKGFVIGVHAGWNPVNDRAVGPKVAYFRSAALAFIND